MNRRKLITGSAAILAFPARRVLAQASPITPPFQLPAILPTSLIQGELVKVTLADNQYYSYSVGTSSVSSAQSDNNDNRDSTNRRIGLTVPPGTTQGASIQTIIYGRVVGVRWRRNTLQPPAFSVVIDGIAYSVPLVTNTYNGLPFANISVTDFDCYHIVAANLPDGAHSVEVILAADPANVATWVLQLYGFVAERRAGYTERPRAQTVIASGTVPASSTAISNSTSSAIIPALRAIEYTNTGGSAATVTVTYNGATFWVGTMAAAGSAGASATCDLLAPTAFNGLTTTFAHSTAGTVSFVSLGQV